ncbi:hypothetical protein [Paractinoplanes brasiliensis]|uniref:PknH-like protein n=1 Tax=Paractinoplanes brasiliensis TaxID=52695 RepID=A0A4R6K2P7_9ACTN|nr:hypothetical protein [Actinoplanes brasiliensis]TDO42431.1 hypothetical protein C8E87_6203 [Actinoplanes brasiliensis]GID29666.1 hypothetical protein Abr02nite_46490 [Actinoplanes brasiliensis]
MPNTELDNAFAALSSDAERGLLLTGPELRRQAGRRRQRGLALTAAATSVLVVGAIGAGWTLAGDNRQQQTTLRPATGFSPSPTPSPSPTSTPTTAAPSVAPSTPPTSKAPALPKSIPARALLSANDKGISDHQRLEDPEPLPEFCARAKFPSRDKAGPRASARMFYRSPDSPPGSVPSDTLVNTVTVYRGSGAEEFMSELIAAVRSCPTGKLGDLDAQYDSLGSLGLGDSSLLIDRSYAATGDDGEPLENGARQHTYVAAVRVGDAITLIDTRGWESGSSDRAWAESLTKTAARRLADWR